MDLLRRTRPSPPQVLQGVLLSPVPSHLLHVCTCWNMPSGVCMRR